MADLQNRGLIVTLILIYYIVLFLVVSPFITVTQDYNIQNSITQEGDNLIGGQNFNEGYCHYPQYDGFNSDRCSKLMDDLTVYDNSSCEEISGCSWTEETTFFFWGSGTYSCSGNINESFYKKIIKPGLLLSHPRKTLTLHNMFVYPYLREKSSDADIPKTERLDKISVSAVDKSNTKLLIFGDGKSGKSTVCRRLFLDYHQSGYIPIIIEGELLERSSLYSFEELINKLIKDQYHNADIDTFIQTNNDKKVIIIDNINRSGDEAKGHKSKYCISPHLYIEYVMRKYYTHENN